MKRNPDNIRVLGLKERDTRGEEIRIFPLNERFVWLTVPVCTCLYLHDRNEDVSATARAL